MLDHEDSEVVEMDTVKGTKVAGKVLLTMIFRRNSVMLLFLMPDCKQNSVIEFWIILRTVLDLRHLNDFSGLYSPITVANSKTQDALKLIWKVRCVPASFTVILWLPGRSLI